MAESVDCSDFCRLCLVKEQVNTPIFEELGDLQQIYIKITACLPIKVSLEDPLPKRICDECSYKLDQQYNFWNTSINAEKQLRQWLGLPEEPPTKSENVSGKIKREKDNYDSPSKRPRRNARRKAAQHVRQAAAAAIAASDSGPGEDMDLDAFTKEENDSDHDFHDNNESMEDTTYTNVGLDSEEHGSEAGPSGLQKGAVTSTNSGTDAGGTGANQKIETVYYNSEIDIKEELTVEENEENNPLYNDTTPKLLKSPKVEQSSTVKKSKSRFKHTHITSLTCPKCNKEFGTRRLLLRHIRRENAVPTKACNICNKLFKYNFEVTNHVKLVHTTSTSPQPRFDCDYCDRSFKINSSLKWHIRKHHEEGGGTFKCTQQFCEKRFQSEKLLQTHVDKDHFKLRHKCEVCNKAYKTREYLQYHQRAAHDPNYVAPSYCCDICGRNFNKTSSLNKHKKTHSNTVDYVCEECGRSFRCLSNLNLHRNVHSNVKQFKCTTCNKQFRCKKFLINHVRTHTGEKPYICDICDKRFTQRTTLVIHMRYHSGIRPYPCNLCDKKFVARSLLNSHVKISHAVMTK